MYRLNTTAIIKTLNLVGMNCMRFQLYEFNEEKINIE